MPAREEILSERGGSTRERGKRGGTCFFVGRRSKERQRRSVASNIGKKMSLG